MTNLCNKYFFILCYNSFIYFLNNVLLKIITTSLLKIHFIN